MSRYNHRGNQGKRYNGTRCSVHGGVIKGKVYYWNHQPMCKNCYKRFTSGPKGRDGVRMGGVRIIRNAPKPAPRPGFFARLFGA